VIAPTTCTLAMAVQLKPGPGDVLHVCVLMPVAVTLRPTLVTNNALIVELWTNLPDVAVAEGGEAPWRAVVAMPGPPGSGEYRALLLPIVPGECCRTSSRTRVGPLTDSSPHRLLLLHRPSS
jgi:hypothetical protein